MSQENCIPETWLHVVRPAPSALAPLNALLLQRHFDALVHAAAPVSGHAAPPSSYIAYLVQPWGQEVLRNEDQLELSLKKLTVERLFRCPRGQ